MPLAPSSIRNSDILSQTARELMTEDVLCVYEGWSVKRLADFFVKHNLSGAPVIASDHELVGVVSTKDVLRFASMSPADKHKLIDISKLYEWIGQSLSAADQEAMAAVADTRVTINAIMTERVVVADPSTSLQQLAGLMHEHAIHRVFITQQGKLCGVVTSSDMIGAIARLA